MRLERPGKACSVTPIDSIYPPVVHLQNGEVLHVHTEDDVRRAKKELKTILYLGDILISYGDFSENGHVLVPAGYCPEWWFAEFERAILKLHGSWDATQISELYGIPLDSVQTFSKDAPRAQISYPIAAHLSKTLGVPLHPSYLFFWKLLKKDQLLFLCSALESAHLFEEEGKIKKMVLIFSEELKFILETLAIPHMLASQDHIVVEWPSAHVLVEILDLSKKEQLIAQLETQDVLTALNSISPMVLRDKAGTFIGARMGRPEKAKMRKLKGSPHTLFPVGEEGGKMRSFTAALSTGFIEADFPYYLCPSCNLETVYALCHRCGAQGIRKYFDMVAEGRMVDSKIGEKVKAYKKRKVPLKEYYDSAQKIAGCKLLPSEVLKGVRGTSNEEHLPEHLTKGLLRAKYHVFVNKDGTTRYDMSELPITHFIPEEIGTSVEKLCELGYTTDIYGTPLTQETQILELKPQDLILPGFTNLDEDACDQVMFGVARFIDDMLVNMYLQEPYYNFKHKRDLIGHLVIGLAPHISAGMVGRIIGFSQTQGMFAHPLYHASLRRDCDGDEACVMLLLDALLNLSRQFLPTKRGAKTMSAPLVLTSKLLSTEVDDQVHGLDIGFRYPLELYEAALEYKSAGELNTTEKKLMPQIKHRLDTPGQYEGMGFTHMLKDMNMGVLCSAYKTLESMNEKLEGQMKIAEMVRAVDRSGVATMVIEKHFLKDIKGNLRKFSTQTFNCTNCYTAYRRPPLSGKCNACSSGKINFTVSEGAVIKYLASTIELTNKYSVTPYLKQVITLTERSIHDVFGKDKEKQTGLNAWFG